MDGWMDGDDDDDGGGDDDDVEGEEKDDEDDNDHNHDDTDQKKEEEGDGAGDENMTRTNEEDLWQWETDATMKTYKASLKQIKTSQSHFKVLHFLKMMTKFRSRQDVEESCWCQANGSKCPAETKASLRWSTCLTPSNNDKGLSLKQWTAGISCNKKNLGWYV